MTELDTGLEGSLGIPEDLREWVGARELVAIVFEAVHAAEEAGDDPLTGRQFHSGQTRILLTLLTFSYAIGMYISEEVEAQSVADPELAYLSGRCGASSVRLRQFRRHYRCFLQRSLGRLFERVLASRGGSLRIAPACDDLESVSAWLAEARINRSVLADTMALDN